MTIFYLLSGLLALVLVIILIKDLVKGKRLATSIPLGHGRSIHLVFATIFILAVPIILVNLVDYEPDLSTKEKRLNYYTTYSEHLDLHSIYGLDLAKTPNDPRLNFLYVSTLTDHIASLKENYAFDLEEFKESRNSLGVIETYKSGLSSADSSIQEQSRIFLALHHLDREEYREAKESISELGASEHPYYAFVRGKTLTFDATEDDLDEAERLFERSIADSVALSESIDQMAIMFYRYGLQEELDSIVCKGDVLEHIDVHIQRIAFMRAMDLRGYCYVVLSDRLGQIDLLGSIAALMILLLWLLYLRQVDVFEVERWSHVLMTLAMSMCTIFLVFPISDFLWDVVNYYPSRDSLGGFVYITVSVGMVEELVKIIPVLILLRWTNAINEPFDYILYCSISALGFAFVENLGYLQHDSLYNINARALMATVAHMVFSSTIGYGLMLVRYRDFGHKKVVLITFFVIAAVMHGFYDFWLLNESVRGYEWVTVVFLIVSIHFWFVYANNTMNISTFYRKVVVIRNDRLLTFLIVGLLIILMTSYLVNSFTRGADYGNRDLLRNSLIYGYLIIYLILSLSRFVLVRGYLAPIAIPFDFLIPKISRLTHFEGLPIHLYAAKRIRFIPGFEQVEYALPAQGILKQRLAVDNNLESYLVRLDSAIVHEGHSSSEVVILPKSPAKTLNDNGGVLIYFLLIPDGLSVEKGTLLLSDFTFAGWAVSKKRVVVE